MEDKRLAHNRKLEVTGKKQQRKKSNHHQLVATAVRPFHGRAESCPGGASQAEPPTTRESADRQQDQPPPPPHQQEADRELLLAALLPVPQGAAQRRGHLHVEVQVPTAVAELVLLNNPLICVLQAEATGLSAAWSAGAGRSSWTSRTRPAASSAALILM
jgi:hypothetical protein